jgi:hypothetical protein
MKRTVISATVLALALSGAGVASAAKPDSAGKPADKGSGAPAESGFRVTGGGQIIADSSGGGAGDTVGFVAQELDGDDGSTDAPNDAARGQFQFVPRGESTNESAPEDRFHGVVTCLVSGGEAQANEQGEDDGNVEEALASGMARFGGYLRDDPEQAFTVDVSDDGQGNGSNDMILVRFTSQPCADNPEDEDDEAEDLMRLGRGNVKIHNNPDGEAATPMAAAQTARAFSLMLQ